MSKNAHIVTVIFNLNKKMNKSNIIKNITFKTKGKKYSALKQWIKLKLDFSKKNELLSRKKKKKKNLFVYQTRLPYILFSHE